MKSWLSLFVLFTFHAVSARLFASGPEIPGNSYDFELPANSHPVTKVVELLHDMKARLSKEAEEDEEVYDKMACWCETNDEGQRKAISDGGARVKSLQLSIKEAGKQSAQLQLEIDTLNGDVTKSKRALQDAIALHNETVSEFAIEERDMLDSIEALREAITTLSKHFKGTAFLEVRSALPSLADVLRRHQDVVQATLTPEQQRLILGLLHDSQEPASPTTPPATFKDAYESQSGQIFGILKQMKETFEENLARAQKEAAQNQKAFEELKSAKEDEIASQKDSIVEKTEEMANADEAKVRAQEDLRDTNASLNADQDFLTNVRQQCQMTDQEWDERQKSRLEEIDAVSRAIAILSSDQARDNFTKSFNPVLSFLQGGDKTSGHRLRAASILASTAAKTRNAAMASLALAVRWTALQKVMVAIDGMVEQLLQEKADESTHQNNCVTEISQVDQDTATAEQAKDGLESRIDQLKDTIGQLTQEIETLQSEIGRSKVEMQRADEDRARASQEFQRIVEEQKETQRLLASALAVLSEVYSKAPGLIQQTSQAEPARPEAPAGFKAYEKQRTTGVVGLLKQIMSDTEAMEASVTKTQESQQKMHEALLKTTNESIAAKEASIVDKTSDRGKSETELTQDETDLSLKETELENLARSKRDLKHNCDFTIENFDARQQARDEEIEALRQAKTILSGAK